MLVCGKMDSDAPESTKKLKLFLCLGGIKFFAGRKDMAVADAGALARVGSEGLRRASGGSVVAECGGRPPAY